MPWVAFGLFPNMQVFSNLCKLLPILRKQKEATTKADMIRELSVDVEGRQYLIDRISDEILATHRPTAGMPAKHQAGVLGKLHTEPKIA